VEVSFREPRINVNDAVHPGRLMQLIRKSQSTAAEVSQGDKAMQVLHRESQPRALRRNSRRCYGSLNSALASSVSIPIIILLGTIA
jgi:hypothetical protein